MQTQSSSEKAWDNDRTIPYKVVNCLFFLFPRAPIIVSKTGREIERKRERADRMDPDRFRDYWD